VHNSQQSLISHSHSIDEVCIEFTVNAMHCGVTLWSLEHIPICTIKIDIKSFIKKKKIEKFQFLLLSVVRF